MNKVSQSLVMFYFSSDMVLISLYIERRNKGGEFIINIQISTTALIREQCLLNYFQQKVWCLFE